MAKPMVRKGSYTCMKRCLKCGVAGRVLLRQRKCYERKFGKGSYACMGALVRVVRIATHTLTIRNPERPQDVAEKKLAKARAMVTAKTRAMSRLATSLRMWEARARKFAKLASLTDAEIATAKAIRTQRASQRAAANQRRGIKIGGTV